MPIGPNGERLPYPGEPGFGAGPDPSMMGGGMPPEAAMMGAPPPETVDGPVAPEVPLGASLDPGALAALAMQAIAGVADIDAAKMQELVMAELAKFQMGQQQAMMAAPEAIAALVAQLTGAGGPPETVDGPVTTMPVALGPDELPPGAPIA